LGTRRSGHPLFVYKTKTITFIYAFFREEVEIHHHHHHYRRRSVVPAFVGCLAMDGTMVSSTDVEELSTANLIKYVESFVRMTKGAGGSMHNSEMVSEA
jgi:hypothetical protein